MFVVNASGPNRDDFRSRKRSSRAGRLLRSAGGRAAETTVAKL